jgi:mono/diheme cytochrome c family protein
MPQSRQILITVLLAGSLIMSLLHSSRASAQDNEDFQEPPKSAESAFALYCAPCHGDDGRGGGPLVFGLSKPPPDLTKLTARNGGTFPRARLARLIDGREDVDAHGSREMPVWGKWFKLEPVGDEEAIRKRIDELLNLLESLQEPGQ